MDYGMLQLGLTLSPVIRKKERYQVGSSKPKKKKRKIWSIPFDGRGLLPSQTHKPKKKTVGGVQFFGVCSSEQTNKQGDGGSVSKKGGTKRFCGTIKTRAQKKPSSDRMTQTSLEPVCVPDVIGALAAWRRNTFVCFSKCCKPSPLYSWCPMSKDIFGFPNFFPWTWTISLQGEYMTDKTLLTVVTHQQRV